MAHITIVFSQISAIIWWHFVSLEKVSQTLSNPEKKTDGRGPGANTTRKQYLSRKVGKFLPFLWQIFTPKHIAKECLVERATLILGTHSLHINVQNEWMCINQPQEETNRGKK